MDREPIDGRYGRANRLAGDSYLYVFTDEEAGFGRAMDRYKRRFSRPHPGWDEVLAVALSLGYRKVEAARPLPRTKKTR